MIRHVWRVSIGRLHDPVIADRSLDLMCAILWACYAGWGIASAIAGLPTIGSVTVPVYEPIWGACIGVLGCVASAAAISTLVNSPTTQGRIRKKVAEMTTVSVLAGFISVYPIFVIGLAVTGDTSRIATIFVAVSYLVVPTWRVRHLLGRIRALRKSQGAAT